MANDIKSLSTIGFSNYSINPEGEIYSIKTKRKLKENNHKYILTADNGQKKTISLKTIYRQIYHKEFCIDNIKDLNNEQWKQIDDRYYISNCGRVKSYCGYEAIILKKYYNVKGYEIVKINNKNKFIHRLVAFYFCENKYKDIPKGKLDIHHTDFNIKNNNYNNLQILTKDEHIQLHKIQKEKQKNE